MTRNNKTQREKKYVFRMLYKEHAVIKKIIIITYNSITHFFVCAVIYFIIHIIDNYSNLQFIQLIA